MAFIPVPSIVQATLHYLSLNNVVAINRLYCAASTVPTVDDLVEIGDALYDVWVAQVMTNSNDNWQLTGIHMRAMNVAEGIQADDANTYPVNGSVASSLQQPEQTTYTVTLSTGLVGRSARGRVYGVGLPLNYQQGVRLTDTGHTALQSAWGLVQTAMETAGHALSVVSFQEGGVPRVTGRALPVLNVSVRFPLATQRRRLA